MPGHTGIEGNERSDEAAKEAAEKAGTQRYPEQFVLLAHVGRTITVRKWKEPKHWFRTENDKRPPLQRSQYDPALKNQGPDTSALERGAQVSRRYLQLRSEHAIVGTYLQHIGKNETDRC